ncbi:hypothetical protein POM88_011792 [Heracleum sosnowskyi]|uniref:Uncharacterized protein n=1 Tax=Heracleum sosnowskyi TaxID=360622 RepID=A0AAD8IW44_9APIA|nr:hypothetical protein POM88_011792 [Heracleum sosnowskyi]
MLNHFVDSDSDSNYITHSQLRTEALGISLAAFSVFVPFLGKFLKGASQVDQASLSNATKYFKQHKRRFCLGNIHSFAQYKHCFSAYISSRILMCIKQSMCKKVFGCPCDDVLFYVSCLHLNKYAKARSVAVIVLYYKQLAELLAKLSIAGVDLNQISDQSTLIDCLHSSYRLSVSVLAQQSAFAVGVHNLG